MKKANGYTINHEESTISTTKVFLQNASIPGSKEFNTLAQLRKVYPDFKINSNKIKVNSTKQKHKGLSIEFMGKYINTRPDGKLMIIEFEAVRSLFNGHPAYYAKVKAWFLSKYPDYNNSVEFVNHVEKLAIVDKGAA